MKLNGDVSVSASYKCVYVCAHDVRLVCVNMPIYMFVYIYMFVCVSTCQICVKYAYVCICVHFCAYDFYLQVFSGYWPASTHIMRSQKLKDPTESLPMDEYVGVCMRVSNWALGRVSWQVSQWLADWQSVTDWLIDWMRGLWRQDGKCLPWLLF